MVVKISARKKKEGLLSRYFINSPPPPPPKPTNKKGKEKRNKVAGPWDLFYYLSYFKVVNFAGRSTETSTGDWSLQARD